jgi:hypothetical protein
MYNQLTDQFKIVQIEIVKALPLVGRLVSADAHQSLVIFRCGEYIGSRLAHNAPTVSMSGHKPITKVKNGNAIYRVSSATYSITITGACSTQDHYMRLYSITLDVTIINPVLFAQGYRLGKDPLKMAVEMTKSTFLNYVAQTKHDVLYSWIPEGQFQKSLAEETGTKVIISAQEIKVDPRHVPPLAPSLEADVNDVEILRAEIQDLKQELRKLQDEQDKTYIEGITMHRMREKEKVFEFKREIAQKMHEYELKELARKEEEAQHIHQLNKQLLETGTKEMAQILQASIRNTFESKESFADVVKDVDTFLKELRGSLLKMTKEDDMDSGTSGAKTNGNYS